MSFLSPLFLLLGGAAAVPLLIHLLRRRVGTRVDFPAVRYLLRAEQENRRTLRLRNMLLMLLRVAAILLLSIAAARPIGHMIGIGHAPAAIAIVVDNTLSSGVVVGGRSMVERFKSAALDIAGSSMPADRVWLVTADGIVAGGTASTIRSAITAVQPTSAAGDLGSAVRRAVGLVRGAAQDARVVIILTDGQRSSWPKPVATAGVHAVVWSPAVTPPDNHAVTLAEARPIRWTPRGEIVARFQAKDSVTYRVTIGGRTFARGTAAPNEETVIHAAPSDRGWVAGSVDLAPDELAADDSRHFAAWIGAAPAVYATASAGEFVVAAVEALRGSGRVVRGEPAASGTRGVAGREIAIGPADEIAALPAMIAAPADPVHLGAANRALDRLGVPWRFGSRRLQTVDAAGAGLGSTPVTDRYELVPQAGADADTLALAARSPWIVAGPRYVLVGSPLIASASGLPVRAGFIPWLATSISDRLSGDPGTVVATQPGAVMKTPTGVDQLERPDGSRTSPGDSISVPMNPGVYFFMSGARRSGALVVNAPVTESTLDRLSSQELGQAIAGATVVAAVDPTAVQSSAFRAASTRSLLPPILIAILATLFAEGLVVAARRRETV
jgi:hypothetical protein